MSPIIENAVDLDLIRPIREVFLSNVQNSIAAEKCHFNRHCLSWQRLPQCDSCEGETQTIAITLRWGLLTWSLFLQFYLGNPNYCVFYKYQG